MEKELQEMIKKHLPEQTVGVLKDELSRIPELANEVEVLKEQVKLRDIVVKAKDEQIKSLRGEIDALNLKVGEYNDLVQREHEVDKRERNALVTELSTQLKCERDKSGIAKELMEVVFRNNTVKRTVHQNGWDNENITQSSCYDNNGNAMPQKNINTGSEATVEQEQ